MFQRLKGNASQAQQVDVIIDYIVRLSTYSNVCPELVEKLPVYVCYPVDISGGKPSIHHWKPILYTRKNSL